MNKFVIYLIQIYSWGVVNYRDNISELDKTKKKNNGFII